MRLVPAEQHSKLRENHFWKLIHPDFRDRGGYHEWAVPAGAPIESNSVRGLRQCVKINELAKNQIPSALKKVIRANQPAQFFELLARSKEIGMTKKELCDIFTHQPDGGQNQSTSTLIHYATQNGHMPIVDAIISYIPRPQDYLTKQDNCGDTPLHVAAYNNRLSVLSVLNH